MSGVRAGAWLVWMVRLCGLFAHRLVGSQKFAVDLMLRSTLRSIFGCISELLLLVVPYLLASVKIVFKILLYPYSFASLILAG